MCMLNFLSKYQFSKVVLPFHVPTRSVCEVVLNHTLSNTCILLHLLSFHDSSAVWSYLFGVCIFLLTNEDRICILTRSIPFALHTQYSLSNIDVENLDREASVSVLVEAGNYDKLSDGWQVYISGNSSLHGWILSTAA